LRLDLYPKMKYNKLVLEESPETFIIQEYAEQYSVEKVAVDESSDHEIVTDNNTDINAY